ncbi:MAG: hypothetical protein UT69_C0002G0001, partial [Candidatus Yanofskybacteria bacterium GW2011_GWE1_40_10]
HVRQYVRHRTASAFGGLMVAEHRNHNLTRDDSDRFMDFSTIPSEIQEMNRETLTRGLRELHISVFAAVHRRAEDAISAAIEQVGVAGLKYEVIPQRMIFDTELMVRFTVEEPNSFTFWHSQSRPGGGFDLYIVPAYHPVMNGKESVGMVNGATDAYIRGNAVRSIYCPEDAQATDPSKNFGTSWNHVKHPFYATGRSMAVKLITTKVRSAESMEELTQLLRAALGLDNKYVDISGGFNAPLKCGYNRIVELGIRSPYPQAEYRRGGNITRGSEQHCVWSYRVLKEEGQLEKAYIPSWFIKEGWLKIYEGAEERHGLY